MCSALLRNGSAPVVTSLRLWWCLAHISCVYGSSRLEQRHQDFIDNPARTSACMNHDGQAFSLNSLSSTCQACTPSSLLLQQSPVCKLLLIYHTCAHTKAARRVKIQVDTHQRWDNLITTGVAAHAIAWPVEAKICQL